MDKALEVMLTVGPYVDPHPIQGIGARFFPDVLNTEIYDEIICVKKRRDDSAAGALLHSLEERERLLVPIIGVRSGLERLALIYDGSGVLN